MSPDADVSNVTLSPPSFHTVRSTSPLVPHTTLSPSSIVPQTTLSHSWTAGSQSSAVVPQTTSAQSAPSQSVPHTTLSSSSATVPQTTLSHCSSAGSHEGSSLVPHTTLSHCSAAGSQTTPPFVPQTTLSHSSSQSVPHTTLSPWSSAAPQVTLSFHAFDLGSIAPWLTRWLPQMIFLLQYASAGYGKPLVATRKYCVRSTAPLVFRNPAPSVSALYPGYTCAVYCRIAFTRFGVSVGFACSINATLPATTGADMLVPVRLR